MEVENVADQIQWRSNSDETKQDCLKIEKLKSPITLTQPVKFTMENVLAARRTLGKQSEMWKLDGKNKIR